MSLICGLVGTPIAHSKSPELHNQWFRERGIDARYELFEQPSEQDAQRFIENFLGQSQALGLNITIPYKQFVTQLGLTADEIVTRLGAANTLYKRVDDGQWCLTNTDVVGFERAVRSLGCDAKNAQVVILGNGGAAKAVALAAERMGAAFLLILCRKPQIAAEAFQKIDLKISFEVKSLSDMQNLKMIQEVAPSVLIVNTIPIGHAGEENVYAMNALTSLQFPYDCYFIDLIYADTLAIHYAQKQGWKSQNGKTMLVEQAKESFKLWAASAFTR